MGFAIIWTFPIERQLFYFSRGGLPVCLKRQSGGNWTDKALWKRFHSWRVLAKFKSSVEWLSNFGSCWDKTYWALFVRPIGWSGTNIENHAKMTDINHNTIETWQEFKSELIGGLKSVRSCCWRRLRGKKTNLSFSANFWNVRTPMISWNAKFYLKNINISFITFYFLFF